MKDFFDKFGGLDFKHLLVFLENQLSGYTKEHKRTVVFTLFVFSLFISYTTIDLLEYILVSSNQDFSKLSMIALQLVVLTVFMLFYLYSYLEDNIFLEENLIEDGIEFHSNMRFINANKFVINKLMQMMYVYPQDNIYELKTRKKFDLMILVHTLLKVSALYMIVLVCLNIVVSYFYLDIPLGIKSVNILLFGKMALAFTALFPTCYMLHKLLRREHAYRVHNKTLPINE